MVMWGIIKNTMMVGRLYSTMMQGIMRSNSTVMHWNWSNVMVGVMGSQRTVMKWGQSRMLNRMMWVCRRSMQMQGIY